MRSTRLCESIHRKHERKSISVFFLRCAATDFRKMYTSDTTTPHEISTTPLNNIIEISSPVNYTAIIVHMGVAIRESQRASRRRDLILANCHVFIVHDLEGSFGVGVSIKRPVDTNLITCIYHNRTREIVRIIVLL